jgi:hypothetical protein
VSYMQGYRVQFTILNNSSVCSRFMTIIKKNNLFYRYKHCLRRMNYATKVFFVYKITDVWFKNRITGIFLIDEKGQGIDV